MSGLQNGAFGRTVSMRVAEIADRPERDAGQGKCKPLLRLLREEVKRKLPRSRINPAVTILIAHPSSRGAAARLWPGSEESPKRERVGARAAPPPLAPPPSIFL